MSERIAVITTSYPRDAGDAAGHFVHSEVRRLLGAGRELHVFAPAVGGDSAGEERDGALVHWLSDRGAFGWPGALPRLKKNPLRAAGIAEFSLRARRELAKSGPFSRVYAHFLLPSAWPIATCACARQAETEFELIGHGSDVRLFCRLPKQLRKRIAQAWLERRARVRVTSQELARLLSAANPELGPALTIAASPIDLEGTLTRAQARNVLGLPPAQKIALIVARLVPEKRVALALQALELVAGVSVIVVGDGPELAELSRRFPRVRFAGHVSRTNALAFIAAADVLVSASAQEGAPTVVREARALGVPVVAVRAGDLGRWAERDVGILLAHA